MGRAHRSRAPTHEQDEDYEDDTLVHWQQVDFDYLDVGAASHIHPRREIGLLEAPRLRSGLEKSDFSSSVDVGEGSHVRAGPSGAQESFFSSSSKTLSKSISKLVSVTV